MTVLDINEIKKILPHRYPMLLVDRILEVEPMKRAVGIKNITANEMQFLGHFPNEPIMPGVLLIEAMAQVGGVAMLYPEENRGKIAVFAKIDNVRFRKQVVPGDQVVTTLGHQTDHLVGGGGSFNIDLAARVLLETGDPVKGFIRLAALDITGPSDDIELAFAGAYRGD